MDAFQPLINLLVLLSALSLSAERVTNVVKLRYESLRDKGANEKKEKERERDVTQVNLGIAILVALVQARRPTLRPTVRVLCSPNVPRLRRRPGLSGCGGALVLG